ncbi:MAG: sulfotransferase [Gammaproteobacteria bacterium]|nr:sulfotransferase [Gammaproteobacteria bacterium]
MHNGEQLISDTTKIDAAWQCYKTNDLAGAHKICVELLAKNADHPDALRLMGLIAYQTGHYDEAVYFHERVLQIATQIGSWNLELARAYKMAGYTNQAVKVVEQALEYSPGNEDYHCFLGDIHAELGRLDEAASHYRSAIQRNKKNTAAISGLVLIAVNEGCELTAGELASIEELADDDALRDREKSLIQFALAELANHEKRYDDAFHFYSSANEAKRNSISREERFNADRRIAATDSIIRFFDKAFFSGWRRFGSQSNVPVFIIGMPRSGTTLVEQILSSHPQVYGAGELRHIGEMADGLVQVTEADKAFPETLVHVEHERMMELAEYYISILNRKAGTALRVINKMPTNFQYLGLIYALFPNAKIIHVRRDPMDTCWSIFRRNLKHKYANSLEDIAVAYQQYVRLMDHWRREPQLVILDVDYEELIRDREEISRGMIKFLELDWDAACLDHAVNSEPVRTLSKLQVRRPLYTDAIGSWRYYEKHLHALREALSPRDTV